MLHSISWLQYAIAISILLTGYYLAIILMYYRPQIMAMVNGKGQYPNDIEPYPAEKKCYWRNPARLERYFNSIGGTTILIRSSRSINRGKSLIIKTMKPQLKFDSTFKRGVARGLILIVLLLTTITLFAQDGNAGINEATNKVKGYLDTGTS